MGAWYFVCDLEQTKELVNTVFGYDASNITDKVEITGDMNNIRKTANAPASSSTKKESQDKVEATKQPTEKQATPSPTAVATDKPDETTEDSIEDEAEEIVLDDSDEEDVIIIE